MKERILYKLNSIIITLIFCLSIFTPFSIGIIEKDKDISIIEKRNLSKYPGTPKKIKDIKKFPKLFDAYYSDHFGFRDWFTEYYKLVKYTLGDSPSKDVTIGKDGWLFLGSIKKRYTGFNDPIGDFRGINLYSQEDLKNFSVHMTKLKLFLNEQGIEYIFVIAPNKHSVYFDKLPDFISKFNEYSSTDQLIEYLKKNTDISVIDLRKKLIEKKYEHQLYFKYDTHWNQYGANIAQYEIMLEIEKLFPDKIQPEIKNIKVAKNLKNSDLSNIMGVNVLEEHYHQPVFENKCKPLMIPSVLDRKKPFTMICDKKELKAVIFRDSFFSALIPYFSREFARSTYIKEKLNIPSLVKYIGLDKPDIIIEEWVERKLPFVPNVNFDSYVDKQNEFSNSDMFIFKNNWKQLKFNKCLIEKNISLQIKTTEKCSVPIIRFPMLFIEPSSKYLIHIKMTSSVKTYLNLFYSDKNKTGYPFSEKNSIHYPVAKGDNDIYISLDYPYLGKHLRLDPIYNSGEVTIKVLEIKKVVEKH